MPTMRSLSLSVRLDRVRDADDRHLHAQKIRGRPRRNTGPPYFSGHRGQIFLQRAVANSNPVYFLLVFLLCQFVIFFYASGMSIMAAGAGANAPDLAVAVPTAAAAVSSTASPRSPSKGKHKGFTVLRLHVKKRLPSFRNPDLSFRIWPNYPNESKSGIPSVSVKRSDKRFDQHLPTEHIVFFTPEQLADDLISPHGVNVPVKVKEQVRDVFMLDGNETHVFYHEFFSYYELKDDKRMRREKTGDDPAGILLFCPKCESNKHVTFERFTEVYTSSGLDKDYYFMGTKYRCANWACDGVQTQKEAYEKRKSTTVSGTPAEKQIDRLFPYYFRSFDPAVLAKLPEQVQAKYEEIVFNETTKRQCSMISMSVIDANYTHRSSNIVADAMHHVREHHRVRLSHRYLNFVQRQQNKAQHSMKRDAFAAFRVAGGGSDGGGGRAAALAAMCDWPAPRSDGVVSPQCETLEGFRARRFACDRSRVEDVFMSQRAGATVRTDCTYRLTGRTSGGAGHLQVAVGATGNVLSYAALPGSESSKNEIPGRAQALP